VQVIDDWVTNRRLGLAFECKVSSGKLLVCSIDLQTDLENNPVARQMLHSLLSYMAGDKFNPAVAVDPERIRDLYVSSTEDAESVSVETVPNRNPNSY
jgi:hypothetical protein